MADGESWARLDALLDAALSRPPAERRAFLDEACPGDTPLRARLGELIAIAETEDPALRPGGGLEGALASELLADLSSEPREERHLAAGARLGRFEIRGLLGKGGVGHVYRAHDPVLGREVAIKALAEAFRADSAALRRFEREARMLATVNHPNVAAIHGFEVIDGASYLVLELVEGETLEERLERGPLAWREAAEVARQIAEALEEAHRKGVVHRDLKPANVKLTGPGRVKVLDFGLARAVPHSGDGTLPDELPSLGATGSGAILGTAPYMSPEQARGLPVDARSDLWALGCVMYEMLAGRRAFAGHNVADVLAAVVRDDVDWSALPADIPPALRHLIERCMRREVRQRLQDAGDARLELTELLAPPNRATPAQTSRTPARRGLVALPWLLAAAALAALGLSQLRRPPAPAARLLHLALPTPPGIELAADFAAPFALSPDGSTLVFLGTDAAGTKRLFVRALDEMEARPLPGTEGAWQPFFSPDGRWVAFFDDGNLKKIALAGGAPVPLAEMSGRPRGGWWGADGTILIARSASSGLSRVSAEGGRLEELTHPDLARGERAHRWPQLLPGGRAVLFTVEYEGNDEEATVEVLSLQTGRRHLLLQGGAFARFLPGGHLLFARGGRLFAVRFDPERLVVEGRPTPVLDGVHFGTGTGGTHIAIADDGTLVYVPGLPVRPERHLSWIDLAGRRTRFPGPARHFRELRLDPRGERVALRIGQPDEAEVWIQDVESGTLSQVTHGLHPWHPIWTRDGRQITVGAQGGAGWQLLSLPVSGGAPVVLHESPYRLYPGDWSPDGGFLVYQELRPGQGWDLEALEFDERGQARGEPQALATTPAHETRPRFSPDGRWLTYASDELDAVPHAYVMPFGRSGDRVEVSRPGARAQLFTGGRDLFYWAPFPSEVRRVSGMEESGLFEVRSDDPVWPSLGRDGTMPSPPFDFDLRTKRLLFLDRPTPDATPPPYRMMLFVGFREEVRRRLTLAP